MADDKIKVEKYKFVSFIYMNSAYMNEFNV